MGVRGKYLIINTFSFFKRLMVFFPSVYNLIRYIPILIIPSRYVSKNGVLTTLILAIILLIKNKPAVLIYYSPIFIFLIFKIQFHKLKFERLVQKTQWLLVVAILYGVLQKIIGFLPFEKAWILSDLSIVNSDNMFIENRENRPFSIFASVPEFSIFCALYFLYFLTKKNIPWSLIGLIGILVSGSRGVMIATIIAIIVVFVFKPKNYFRTILSTICVSLFFYLGLILGSSFLTSISDKFSSSRILLYGTFNGRVENLLNRIEGFEFSHLIIPSSTDASEASDLTFDNLHANLLLNFGIIGFMVFWRSFKFIENNHLTHLYFALFISFGFFNDLIFSVYSLLLFFVSIYGTKK